MPSDQDGRQTRAGAGTRRAQRIDTVWGELLFEPVERPGAPTGEAGRRADGTPDAEAGARTGTWGDAAEVRADRVPLREPGGDGSRGAGAAGASPRAQTAPPGDGAALRARAEAHAAARSLTASGRPRADRAAQFMPFAALRGYYELVREQQRVREPRHELTDEEALALSRTATRVRPGMLVRVTYYDVDAYVTLTGCVARIEPDLRRLTVIKTPVPFDDIRALEVIEA